MRATPKVDLPPKHAYVRVNLPWFPYDEGLRYSIVPTSLFGDGPYSIEDSPSVMHAVDQVDGTSLVFADGLITEWMRRAEPDEEAYWPCVDLGKEDGVAAEWHVVVSFCIPEEDWRDLPPRISTRDFGDAFREWVRDMVSGMFGDGEAGL